MARDIRIGHGVDLHRFDPGRPLFLGGIEIPGGPGLEGHSDADVLLHAVTDALLGALALGDIGVWFPNNDPQWKGRASSHFVAVVLEEIKRRGWRVGNIDCNLISEKPKLSPHFDVVRRSVASLLEVEIDQVSVKATTPEKLGGLGRGEGMYAEATVLLTRD
jgi:2-C-methyl-D-erythritol 2,4-cyclodiphosphate synthase